MSDSTPTPRAVPFYCPYCGEEDLVPSGDDPGTYECRSCTRHFRLHFLGLGVPRSEREAPDAF